MIKLRLSAFTHEDSDKNISFVEKELVPSLVSRALSENGVGGKEEFFQILVNGHLVPREFWGVTQITETDTVLIAPIVKSGSFGEIFKSVAVLMITVAVAAYTGGGGLGFAGLGWGAGSGLAAGLAAIGTSLLLNSLIPPPVPGGLGIGSDSSSFENSQMYAISSQSNSAKKFGSVPKVYGRHRLFPNIVANPYTEIETDPSTGELVQYLYAIYDFGFGPNLVSNLKIGDTSISSYSDIFYRFVDLNRPVISEGVWDDYLNADFLFYKGDPVVESLSVAINSNQEDAGALEDYLVERSSAENVALNDQEITITFACPRGLIAYSTNGDSSNRTIELDIQFSKKGQNIWRNFNNTDFVNSYSVAGGDSSQEVQYLVPVTYLSAGAYESYFGEETTDRVTKYISGQYRSVLIRTFPEIYYIPSGRNWIVLEDGLLNVGKRVFYSGQLLGVVTSTSPWSAGYVKYFLDRAINQAITVHAFRYYYETWDGGSKDYYLTEDNGINKFYRPPEGRFKISRKETSTAYSTVKFAPKERGQFDIRIIRVRTSSAHTYQVVDDLVLTSIRTNFNSVPIITSKRHTFLEVKIRATNQLNGAIPNLSGEVSSVLDVWNGTAWVKQATSNPAWIFADLLTGQVSKRPLNKDRLHAASLLEWAQFCDEIPTAPSGQDFFDARYKCNFVLDYDTTLQSVLNQVANASQASLNLIDGKYGALLDKRKTIPVQVFTPRNSFGFSSTKNYSVRPHALKVRYVDPLDWEIRERIVYDDGYTELTSTEFEELSSFACTSSDQAWRFGRYMIAQNKLRQETISLNVDFEFIVCTRGDYVQITQDVMKVGGTPARVKTVVGNRVTIDDAITTAVGLNYGYVARSTTGIVTNTLTVINSDTFQLNGVIPNVGDLIVIGEVGSIVYDCLVKSITPNDDLTAQLILIEKADAVYDAESTSTIPPYNPRISRTSDVDQAPPEVTELAVIANSWLCGANSFEHYIELDWDVPLATAFEYFEIFVDNGRGYNNVTTTRESFYRYFVDNSRLGFNHSFKVIAVSSTGKKLELASVSSVSAIPERKTSRPGTVSSLGTNITGEVLQLDWEPVNDCIREYLIRYSPTTNGTWEASIPLLRVDKNTTLASTQARTGTYLIKAVDFNENESEKATLAITTIPELFNLNIISAITDFPSLIGAKDQVRKEGNSLVLKNKQIGGVDTNEYFSSGYYYYTGFLDLGDIYTVRLQSLIQAEGYTVEDIMANWVTLDSVVALANSRFSEWDVQTEYRTTETFNVMSDWVSLSLVDPISEGVQDNWTEWRRFTIGDGTGRIFQFRLKLISNKASVTPRVFDGTIKADMPDRLESYQNLVAPSTGYEITYSPAFKGPATTPSVQITLENGESGDYWAFDYRSLSGFKILFYNKDGIAVSRVFDAQVKGFGRKALYII